MRLRIMSAALAISALLLFGCTEQPAPPTFDNPLDPAGANGGDPFQIEANYVSGKVYVSWEALSIPTIDSYMVLHAPTADGPWSAAGTSPANVPTFTHEDFLPNAPNFYLVRAMDADGELTSISGIAMASVLPPPHLAIGDTNFVNVLDVQLTIRSAIGDSAQVDSLADFSSGLPAISLDVTPDEDDLLTVTVPWTFQDAPEGADSHLHLYLRVFTGGAVSETMHDSVRVAFTPAFRVQGAPATVGRFTPTLEILGEGIDQMRFALDEAGLGATGFVDHAPTIPSPALADMLDAQDIFAELSSVFGFSDTLSISVQPDDLASLDPIVNSGQVSTSDSLISVVVTAGATFMRIGLDGFTKADPTWQDYTPFTEFRLEDPCAEGPDYRVIVSTQFRNDFVFTSPIYNDTLSWIPPDLLQIDFAVADTLAGGQTHALAGTATPHTCGGALALIELDTGTGWQAAGGLADWTLDWDAPSVTADSLVTLLGRAIAGGNTATASHEVILTP